MTSAFSSIFSSLRVLNPLTWRHMSTASDQAPDSQESTIARILPDNVVRETIVRLEQSLTLEQKQIYELQLNEFQTNSIPNISAPIVQTAKVCEGNEPFIDVFKLENCPIKQMPPELMKLFGGIPSPVAGCMRISNYQKLMKMLNLLPHNMNILLYEAYRKPEQQMQDWLLSMSTYLKQHPGVTLQSAIPEVNKMVSPIMSELWWSCISDALLAKGINLEEQLLAIEDVKEGTSLPADLVKAFFEEVKPVTTAYDDSPDAPILCVPPHTTGGAVDFFFAALDKGHLIPIWEGKPGAMDGDNPTSLTFTDEGLTPHAQNIKKMIYLAALSVGLINYGNEFWHFEGSTTRLNSRYTSNNEATATFGLLVEEEMKKLLVEDPSAL